MRGRNAFATAAGRAALHLTLASPPDINVPSEGGYLLFARLGFRFYLSLFSITLLSASPLAQQGLRFEVSFAKEANAAPLDGHVLLFLSTNDREEPRFQIAEQFAQSQQAFGVDGGQCESRLGRASETVGCRGQGDSFFEPTFEP